MDISPVILVIFAGIIILALLFRKGFFKKSAWVSDDPIYAKIDEEADEEADEKSK